MPTSIQQSLLNPSIGIGDLMAMPNTDRLPQSRELASSSLNQTGLEGLYGETNARTAVESLLCPNVGDGTLVSPEVFEASIAALVRKLSRSTNPKVKLMCEK